MADESILSVHTSEDWPNLTMSLASTVVPLDRLQCSGVDGDYDEEMEVEIIEVEEPAEPVPMQDCCLQVKLQLHQANLKMIKSTIQT